MAASDAYLTELNHLLTHRRIYLEDKRIPVLKEQFRIYHGAYTGILNVLLKKGLVAEDPYKGDQRISDVAVPDDNTFLESERDEQLSIRLAAFENQLDFLNNYVQFSLDYLDLKRLKILAGLAAYIKWPQLTETSTHMLTRSVAQCLTKLRAGGDQLSLGIVTDNHNQLVKSTNTIIQILREVGEYQREFYKFEIREHVLPHVELDPTLARRHHERVFLAIKKGIGARLPGRPYVGELIAQLLDEDYGDSAEDARQAVLQRLRVEEEKPKLKRQDNANLRILFEALRTMAGGGRYIETAVQKLRDNYAVLTARPRSLGERLKEWIDRVVRQAEPSTALTVEYVDEQTSAVRHEQIEFEPFCEDALKRAKVLGGIQSRMGTTYKKLQQAPEQQVFQFANRQIDELFLIRRRLEALDTYLRSEIPREHRGRLRTLQEDVEALHDYLVRANKKRHSYVAKLEEIEQLRRLGVESNG